MLDETARQNPAQTGTLNMLKICVGADSIDDLAAWQKSRAGRQGPGGPAHPVHVTRMWPRRAEELLAGGSLYWVIKGTVCVRQQIVGLERVMGADEVLRCAIVLDSLLVKTEARPHRPFQGWRYLSPSDVPPDLVGSAAELKHGDLPPDLSAALAALGLRER